MKKNYQVVAAIEFIKRVQEIKLLGMTQEGFAYRCEEFQLEILDIARAPESSWEEVIKFLIQRMIYNELGDIINA